MAESVWRRQEGTDAESVAPVSSKSGGPGTRKNIDEFTRTTAGAVARDGGADEGKAIIVINPAEPPMIMGDTIHCLTVDEPRQKEIDRKSVVKGRSESVRVEIGGRRIIEKNNNENKTQRDSTKNKK